MPQMVRELVGIGGLWKKDIIDRYFNEEGACVILSMPLSKFGCSDRHIWHYTPNGLYSVKSGYMIAQKMNHNGEIGRKGMGQSGGEHIRDHVWTDLWKLQVRPKLRHFIWKSCKNILVIRMNLLRREVRLETNCPICGN